MISENRRYAMKRMLIIILVLTLSGLACRVTQRGPAATTKEVSPLSDKRCGDGICDGAEDVQNCPEDCAKNGAVNQQRDEPVGSSPITENEQINDGGYRKVSFSGTINTSLNTATMGDFTGDAFEYTADYSVELWFPPDGGEAIKQHNTLILTEYNDLFFGEPQCRPCEWVLNPDAFEPYSFELQAALNLNGIMEGDEPADELVYQLNTIPDKTLTGIVSCPCPGAVPDEFSDPAALPALAAWFMQKMVNPIHLGAPETNTVDHFPISPIYDVNIPLETLSYTIVSGLE